MLELSQYRTIKDHLLARVAALTALLAIAIIPIVSCGEGESKETLTTLQVISRGAEGIMVNPPPKSVDLTLLASGFAVLVVICAVAAIFTKDAAILAVCGGIGTVCLWITVSLYNLAFYRVEPGTWFLSLLFGAIIFDACLSTQAEPSASAPAMPDT